MMEQKVKQALGELSFTILVLQDQLETANKKINELTITESK